MIGWAARGRLIVGVCLVTIAPFIAISSDSAFGAAAAPSCLIAHPGTKLPVVLVHGFNSTSHTWDADVTALNRISTITAKPFVYGDDTSQDKALSYHWVTDPEIGHDLAEQIDCIATASHAQGGPGQVLLVGHSMGGLAIRCAIDPTCNDGSAGSVSGISGDVADVITFGTPNTGSFLRGGRGLSDAENVIGPLLIGLCENLDTLGTLDDLCQTVTAFATGDAAKAFSTNSKELKDLPEIPSAVPMLAIAGKVTVTTSVGPFWTTTLDGDAGDLAVGTDSARNKNNKTSNGLGGTAVESCGSLDLSQTAGLLGAFGALDALAAPLAIKDLLAPLICTHIQETSNDAFLTHITTQATKYLKSIKPSAPTCLTSDESLKDIATGIGDLYEAFKVSSVDCDGVWAVAVIRGAPLHGDGSHGAYVDTFIGVYHYVNGRWTGVSPDNACSAVPKISRLHAKACKS